MKGKKRFIFFYLLIFFQVLVIFLFIPGRNSFLEYDESNTLRIASLSFEDIKEVLSHEQNFPLYYLIVRFLFLRSENYVLIAVFANFLIWLFSIFVFDRLLRVFFSKENLVVFFLWLYTLVSSISYYAFRVGVYGLLNLLFLAFFYFFLQYLEKEDFSWLLVSGFCLLILSLLHPISLIFILICFLVSFLMIKKKEDFFKFFLILISSLSLVFFQIFSKTDLRRIYFEGGVEYIRDQKIAFYEYSSLLLFFYGKWNLAASSFAAGMCFFFYLLVFYLFYQFVKSRLFSSKSNFFIFLFSGLFFLMPFLVRSFMGKHFIFFISPFLIALFLGISSLRKARYLSLVVFFFFATYNCQALLSEALSKLK